MWKRGTEKDDSNILRIMNMQKKKKLHPNTRPRFTVSTAEIWSECNLYTTIKQLIYADYINGYAIFFPQKDMQELKL